MKPKPPASPAQVAERAHSIWEKAGRPTGQDLAHWFHAEAQLAAEAGAPAKRRQPARTKKVAAKKPAEKKAAAKAEPAPSQPKKRSKTASKGAATRKTARRPRPRAES